MSDVDETLVNISSDGVLVMRMDAPELELGVGIQVSSILGDDRVGVVKELQRPAVGGVRHSFTYYVMMWVSQRGEAVK